MVLEDLRVDGNMQNVTEQVGGGARPWAPPRGVEEEGEGVGRRQ